MVIQLQSDVRAYLPGGEVIKRYIKVEEVAYEYGFAEIDTSACNMAEYLIKEMARKQGVTEQLKAEDMMRWVGLMNNIRACADEIVLNDIVYS